MLWTNAYEVQQVKMWQWYSCNVVKVVDEGEPGVKFAQVYSITESGNRSRKLIPFYLALEELFNVEDEETLSFALQILLLWLPIVASSIDDDRFMNSVADCVKVALVHIIAALDFQTFVNESYFPLLVVYLNGILRDTSELIHVLLQLISGYKERIEKLPRLILFLLTPKMLETPAISWVRNDANFVKECCVSVNLFHEWEYI